MVNICQSFVESRNLKFGTNANPEKSKTICIVFSKKAKANFKPANIMLNGDGLPWVTQVKHLGYMLQADNSMKVDVAQKRGAFIGKINSLLQEFHFVNPDVMIKLMITYTTSLYGSNTWDQCSPDCQRLYTSYNLVIRQIHKIEWCSHRYLIEPLSKCLHLKTMIASRYVSFYRILITSKKTPVRFLARIAEQDQRTVLGRTMSRLLLECNLEPENLTKLTAGLVKTKLKYMIVPQNEEWRVALCQELLKIRDDDHTELRGFSPEECEELLQHICVS